MNKNYNYLYFETLPSTNTYCKEQIDKLSNYTLVQTGKQTKGRGRLGHTWDSSSDNLAMSFLIKDVEYIKKEEFLNAIPLISSCAVNKVLRRSGLDILIKWPNDQVYNDQKLCGILIEALTLGSDIEAIIIGIGINLNQRVFDTSYPATSLLLLTNEIREPKIYAHLVIEELLCEIEKYLLGDKSYITYNNQYSSLIGRFVSYYQNSEKYYGKVLGINDFGELVVDDKVLKYGEVSLVRKEEIDG